MDNDLSSLGLEQLLALQDKVKNEIENRKAQALEDGRAQVKAIADGLGVSLFDLIDKGGRTKSKSQGGKVAIKYRHPDDAGKHWTGRGRQPRWIEEWIAGASGRSLNDLEVKAG